MTLPEWAYTAGYAFLNLLTNLGDEPPAFFDAIIVGAGAGGCPLAQTLVEDGGLKVLLVERGRGERLEASKTIFGTWDAMRSDCAEVIRSTDGISIISGNCVGGATSFNLGMYLEETPEWIIDNLGSGFATEDEINGAYEWVRDRIGAAPTYEAPGSASEEYIQAVLKTFEERGDIGMGSVGLNGSSRLEEGKFWRTHSTFDPITGERHSADRMLDLENENLELRTNSQVIEILFDGDPDVPATSESPTENPRARCVRFADRKVQCVREGGRIYIAAGAVHTAELLLKSGIRNGGKIHNPEVGENFSDKPLLPLAGNFGPSFDMSGQVTFGHLAGSNTVATGQNKSKLVLQEEFGYGVPGLLKVLGSWRNNFPASGRNRFSAAFLFRVIDFCQEQVETQANPFFLCDQFMSQIDNGCDTTTGMTIAIANPSSKGKVYLNSLGELRVDGGFLTTDDDIEALGIAAQLAFKQLSSRSGPTALQAPCEDAGDKGCTSQSCPDIMADLLEMSKAILAVIDPETSRAIPSAPASIINPNFFELYLKSSDDDLVVGELLSEWIISGYHYVGTAGIGAVVDENLKVYGTEGLYVADASVIPRTPRVNSMALVLMVGRIAAIKFLKERGASWWDVWQP